MPETAPRPSAAQPGAALPAVPTQSARQAVQTAQTAQTAASSQPHNDESSTTQATPLALLNDSDKIEKEWVNKIERIIKETRHDPYRQSEQLTLAKADYMKKRYNKVIKVEK
jgi:hypothetical protein